MDQAFSGQYGFSDLLRLSVGLKAEEAQTACEQEGSSVDGRLDGRRKLYAAIQLIRTKSPACALVFGDKKIDQCLITHGREVDDDFFTAAAKAPLFHGGHLVPVFRTRLRKSDLEVGILFHVHRMQKATEFHKTHEIKYLSPMKNAVFALIVLVLSACGGDPLDGEYNAFEGRFDWFVSSTESGALVLNDPSKLIDANKTGYTAEIQITDEGRILFYRDGFLLTDNAFVILDKSSQAAGASLRIELKRSTGTLTLANNELSIELTNDTLRVDAYPFSSIDDEGDYLNDETAEIQGNYFVRE